MYVIKCLNDVELFEDKQLAARPSSITIIANENDPMDWHGSLTIKKPIDDKLKQSLKVEATFAVAFKSNGQILLGLINITEVPVDMGLFFWVEFRGNDIFHQR